MCFFLIIRKMMIFPINFIGIKIPLDRNSLFMQNERSYIFKAYEFLKSIKYCSREKILSIFNLLKNNKAKIIFSHLFLKLVSFLKKLLAKFTQWKSASLILHFLCKLVDIFLMLSKFILIIREAHIFNKLRAKSLNY
jgi:hypothetical protein